MSEVVRESASLKTLTQRSSLMRRILARLFWAIPTLIFISLVTFTAGELAPRDAATLKAGDRATKEVVDRIREEMGLNRPFLVRYGEFVWGAVRFDFGQSLFQPRKVNDILLEGIGMTGMLAICAIVLASLMGILLGGVAAVWHNKVPDRLAVSFSTLGICIPSFVLAPILVYVFAVKMEMLPVSWGPDASSNPIPYLILPVFILSLRPSALITRLTRAGMIETLSQDFVRTAFAKGVPFWKVIIKHAFRNTLVPIVTAIGTTFGFLLTGSFILETIFRIPGLGLASIRAIQQSDYPVIQATVLLFAVGFIVINLIVDLLLPLIDPRIREGAA